MQRVLACYAQAISWGKIRIDAKPVKVYCDASLAFPIIVASSFAKYKAQRDAAATPAAADA